MQWYIDLLKLQLERRNKNSEEATMGQDSPSEWRIMLYRLNAHVGDRFEKERSMIYREMNSTHGAKRLERDQ